MYVGQEKALRKKWMNEFDRGGENLGLTYVSPTLKEEQLVSDIVNFHAAMPHFSKKLFELNGNVESWHRLGKGELLLYFMYDDVELGGHSSSIDIWIDGQPRIEVKSTKREGDKYASFMLGIDEVPASLNFFMGLLSLFQKKEEEGKILMPERYVNITRSQLDKLCHVAEAEYISLEKKYLDELLSGPAGQKQYLFFDVDLALPIYFGKLTSESLKIERVSGGLTRLWFSPEGFPS